jgi:hypothetical protein
MKILPITIVLLTASLLTAQEVKPTDVNFGQVPVGQTSPQLNVSFENTGDSDLTLAISITGPFAIPVNRCGNGVRIGTHCNVFVTYSPRALETDTGTLAFDYGGGTVSVPLTGIGATAWPTTTGLTVLCKYKDHSHYCSLTISVKSVRGEVIPNGEPLDITCDGQLYLAGQTPGGEAAGPTETGQYQCYGSYAGDANFQPSQSKAVHFAVWVWENGA